MTMETDISTAGGLDLQAEGIPPRYAVYHSATAGTRYRLVSCTTGREWKKPRLSDESHRHQAAQPAVQHCRTHGSYAVRAARRPAHAPALPVRALASSSTRPSAREGESARPAR